MLIPRRVKHRKQHHPKRKGMAKGGTEVAFGEWGIQAVTPAYVTNRQIEAARISMNRHIKRGGKVWINIYPERQGKAKGGTRVTFGEFGIQALEPAYVTNRQIESARIAMTRHIKRGGKVWINIYPDRPITKKPAETRMGSGKGSPEWWVANVKPGRVMFELSGVDETVAREAMRRAMHKLPMKCRFISREAGEF